MQSSVGTCHQVCCCSHCGGRVALHRYPCNNNSLHHPPPPTHPYCKHCTDSPLAHAASTVADAVVRFELLATDLNSPVKLSFIDPANGSHCKATGSFVLYNYARMCAVLANFDKSVSAGEYMCKRLVNELMRRSVRVSILFVGS